MSANWRLLVLVGYALFLAWQFADVMYSGTGFGDLLFLVVFLSFALAPVAILCLVSMYKPAMGIAALFVAAFGVWAYDANGGDPIGLFIVVFYQFCIMSIAFLAILGGASFLERWR